MSVEYASCGCHHLAKSLFSNFQSILNRFLFLKTLKIFSLLLLLKQNFASQISKNLQDHRIPSHLKDPFDCYLHYILYSFCLALLSYHSEVLIILHFFCPFYFHSILFEFYNFFMNFISLDFNFQYGFILFFYYFLDFIRFYLVRISKIILLFHHSRYLSLFIDFCYFFGFSYQRFCLISCS